MSKIRILTLLAGIALSGTLFAKNIGTCNYPLEEKLNYNTYQTCMTKLNTCPKDGVGYNENCIKKTANQTASCHQLKKLASYLNVNPDMINIKSQGNMHIINVSFMADGGHSYYLISPTGCLIDTNVDPRYLSNKLKKEYYKKDFFVEAIGEPSYTTTNGIQRFTANIAAKNQCRACEVIGTATVNFDFSSNGKWLKTSLVEFKAT